MGIFSIFTGKNTPPEPDPKPRIMGSSPFDGFQLDLSDPRLSEFLREGDNIGDVAVTAITAVRNTAVLRALDVICGTIGKLPLYLMQKNPDGSRVPAEKHPLYSVLMFQPNNFQTPHQFKSYLQYQMLTEGDAYALVVRSGARVTNLIPLPSRQVSVNQNSDWSLSYTYTKPDGSKVVYDSTQILHLRGLSRDGIHGISRVKEARNALALAHHAERAALKLFKNGMILGGFLQHPKKLSSDAHDRLKDDMRENYSGSEQAWQWLIAEENMNVVELKGNAASSQHLEQRRMQIEEVARVFGIPRPLLMMDDTSWGTGIEQLAILFVRFGLSDWFKVWEEPINITLLSAQDRVNYYADFDEKELLRGSMKDQADYYAKALGSGGQPAWMTANEVRDDIGLGDHPDGDILAQQNVSQPQTPGSTTNSVGKAANDQ